jgi:hypothetical protein
MRQFWTRLTSPRTRPFWAYLAVALVILGPALLPGYILTLDMVFTPQLHLPLTLSSQLPFNLLLTALNVILPGWLIQKLLLITIFTLAGLGLHRLAPTSSLRPAPPPSPPPGPSPSVSSTCTALAS